MIPAAAEIESVNTRLQRSVTELERLGSEKTMLIELGDVLYSCSSMEEAFAAIGRGAPLIFPGAAGQLFAVNPSHNHMRLVASWADPKSRADVFTPEDCWAVRRGSVHVVTEESIGSLCPHTVGSLATRHNCLPLMAQEGTIACCT